MVSGVSTECKVKKMKEKTMQILLYFVMCMSASLTSGCAASTVVEENGKPLAGVHVVAEWWATGPGYYSNPSHCVRLEALVTGSDGKFDFPYFSGNFNPVYPTRQRNIKFFKTGYELVPNQTEGSDPVKMRPFSGDPKQRFEDDYYIYSIQCEEFRTKLYPLAQEIYNEAKILAVTYKHKQFLIMVYERGVNIVRVGEEQARKIAVEKLERLETEEGTAKK